MVTFIFKEKEIYGSDHSEHCIAAGTGFHMYADDLVISSSAVATWVQDVNTALPHQLLS